MNGGSDASFDSLFNMALAWLGSAPNLKTVRLRGNWLDKDQTASVLNAAYQNPNLAYWQEVYLTTADFSTSTEVLAQVIDYATYLGYLDISA